jgi:hypothetical protein
VEHRLPRGREPFTTRLLGQYLQEEEDGRVTLLRGKWASCYLEDVPRGYVRNYILKAWVDDMSEEERELFEQRTQEKNP